MKPIASLFRSTPRRPEQDLVTGDLASIETHFKTHFAATLDVRKHPRARNLTLRVNAATRRIVITIPRRASKGDVTGFILTNYAWITERLDNAPQVQAFVDGGEIPLRGRLHRIRFLSERPSGRGVVIACSGEVGPELHVFGQAEHCPRRLKDWLIKAAKSDLEQRTRHHASELGVSFKRITVRDQASRWGSCSSTGTLSFSWRLILAPAEILDYVAAHEVAHLQEMNHSPAFWSLVARLCPEFKSAEHWLTHEGPDLHRYCPTHLM